MWLASRSSSSRTSERAASSADFLGDAFLGQRRVVAQQGAAGSPSAARAARRAGRRPAPRPAAQQRGDLVSCPVSTARSRAPSAARAGEQPGERRVEAGPRTAAAAAAGVPPASAAPGAARRAAPAAPRRAAAGCRGCARAAPSPARAPDPAPPGRATSRVLASRLTRQVGGDVAALQRLPGGLAQRRLQRVPAGRQAEAQVEAAAVHAAQLPGPGQSGLGRPRCGRSRSSRRGGSCGGFYQRPAACNILRRARGDRTQAAQQMRCRMQVQEIDAIVLDGSVKGMPSDVAGFRSARSAPRGGICCAKTCRCRLPCCASRHCVPQRALDARVPGAVGGGHRAARQDDDEPATFSRSARRWRVGDDRRNG